MAVAILLLVTYVPALSTWLLRIAANNCLNRIRRRNVRAGREVFVNDFEEAGGVVDDFLALHGVTGGGRLANLVLVLADGPIRQVLITLDRVREQLLQALAARLPVPDGAVQLRHREHVARRLGLLVRRAERLDGLRQHRAPRSTGLRGIFSASPQPGRGLQSILKSWPTKATSRSLIHGITSGW